MDTVYKAGRSVGNGVYRAAAALARGTRRVLSAVPLLGAVVAAPEADKAETSTGAEEAENAANSPAEEKSTVSSPTESEAPTAATATAVEAKEEVATPPASSPVAEEKKEEPTPSAPTPVPVEDKKEELEKVDAEKKVVEVSGDGGHSVADPVEVSVFRVQPVDTPSIIERKTSEDLPSQLPSSPPPTPINPSPLQQAQQAVAAASALAKAFELPVENADKDRNNTTDDDSLVSSTRSVGDEPRDAPESNPQISPQLLSNVSSNRQQSVPPQRESPEPPSLETPATSAQVEVHSHEVVVESTAENLSEKNVSMESNVEVGTAQPVGVEAEEFVEATASENTEAEKMAEKLIISVEELTEEVPVDVPVEEVEEEVIEPSEDLAEEEREDAEMESEIPEEEEIAIEVSSVPPSAEMLVDSDESSLPIPEEEVVVEAKPAVVIPEDEIEVVEEETVVEGDGDSKDATESAEVIVEEEKVETRYISETLSNEEVLPPPDDIDVESQSEDVSVETSQPIEETIVLIEKPDETDIIEILEVDSSSLLDLPVQPDMCELDTSSQNIESEASAELETTEVEVTEQQSERSSTPLENQPSSETIEFSGTTDDCDLNATHPMEANNTTTTATVPQVDDDQIEKRSIPSERKDIPSESQSPLSSSQKQLTEECPLRKKSDTSAVNEISCSLQNVSAPTSDLPAVHRQIEEHRVSSEFPPPPPAMETEFAFSSSQCNVPADVVEHHESPISVEETPSHMRNPTETLLTPPTSPVPESSNNLSAITTAMNNSSQTLSHDNQSNRELKTESVSKSLDSFDDSQVELKERLAESLVETDNREDTLSCQLSNDAVSTTVFQENHQSTPEIEAPVEKSATQEIRTTESVEEAPKTAPPTVPVEAPASPPSAPAITEDVASVTKAIQEIDISDKAVAAAVNETIECNTNEIITDAYKYE